MSTAGYKIYWPMLDYASMCELGPRLGPRVTAFRMRIACFGTITMQILSTAVFYVCFPTTLRSSRFSALHGSPPALQMSVVPKPQLARSPLICACLRPHQAIPV